MPDFFAGLAVGPLAPAIEAQAEALRAEGADVVVALAHAGADCKRFDDPHDLSSCDSEGSELFSAVRAVRPGLVDAWIGGHTHAGVAHFVNGVPVVEALSRGKAFGRIDLELSGSPPRVLRAKPFPPEPLCPDSAELAPCPTHAYAGQNVEPSPAVAAVVAPALDICRHERDRLLGIEIGERFPADHDAESALGNLFVDLMRAQVPGADAALANGGSLRMPLDAGPLSYGALYDTMPFDNRLVTIELTGKELRTVLETHLAHDAHGIVSIAGVVAQGRCEHGQLRLKLRRSSGGAIDDRARLSIVTSDYLATGGDRLLASIGDSRTADPQRLTDAAARRPRRTTHQAQPAPESARSLRPPTPAPPTPLAAPGALRELRDCASGAGPAMRARTALVPAPPDSRHVPQTPRRAAPSQLARATAERRSISAVAFAGAFASA